MTDSVGFEPFDFRKPSGLPEPVDQRLLFWQRGLASLAPERWSQHMTTAVTMEHAARETMMMVEARRQLPDAGIGCRIDLGADALPTLFVFARPLLLALVGQVLGENLTQLPADRPLTTIEHTVSELLFEELANAIGEAWPEQSPLDCCINGFDDKPQRSRMYPLGERVLLSRFDLNSAFGSQPVHWLSAQDQLIALLGQADDVGAPVAPAKDGPLQARAAEIPVQVIVRLGSAELHVSDLADLQVGDVILLDQKIDEPLEAQVAGLPKYRGWPGRVGTRQAIQIDELV